MGFSISNLLEVLLGMCFFFGQRIKKLILEFFTCFFQMDFDSLAFIGSYCCVLWGSKTRI